MLDYVSTKNESNSFFHNKVKPRRKALNRGARKLSIREYAKSKDLLHLLKHIKTKVALAELRKLYGF